MKYWDDEQVQLLDFKQGELVLPLGQYPARRGLLVEFGVPIELIEVEIVPNTEQDADIPNIVTGDVVRMHCVEVETRMRGMEANAIWRVQWELVPLATLRLDKIPTGHKNDPIEAYNRAMKIV